MVSRILNLCTVLAVLAQPPATAAAQGPASRRSDLGRVELIRDTWGIPHVFAESDAGAMYGLGLATAEDRAAQMTLSLRIIQGRLAEVIGDVAHTRKRSVTAVTSDRMMRTFGWERAAERIAGGLDAPTRNLLEAYCLGVNDSFAQQGETLGKRLAGLGLTAEPWRPADCLLSWWHMAQFFGTDGTRDLISWRNLSAPPRGARGGRAAALPPANPPRAENAVVVQRADVADDWLADVRTFAEECGFAGPGQTEEQDGRKFSHAWVVGGARTTTESAVLCSDPQTPVRNPSMFYEFHVAGETFDARGIGVPGSPLILIGWNRHVAWGMTALGADQADLFRLKTDPAQPGRYEVDGEWQEMEVRTEEIAVRGGASRSLRIRETRWGPVVTPFCFARPGEPEVALKRVPLCDRDVDTAQGGFAMLRAHSAAEFCEALDGFRFPSANVVFGDSAGHIGYSVGGAIPIRSSLASQGGRAAHDGSSGSSDWRGFVPSALVPQCRDPQRGFLESANHRPIGPWYPIPLGIQTGSGGDTVRSWRLRELLSEREVFTPEDVLAVHHDSTQPARRDLVRLGLHLAESDVALDESATEALRILEPWLQAGARSDLTADGAALAGQIPTLFRMVATPLTGIYGGGDSGLCSFLKTETRRIGNRPEEPLPADVREYVERCLVDAWASAGRRFGPDPEEWDAHARREVTRRRLGYLESLDGFPSPEPALTINFPALTCVDGGTIKSQAAQCYTQWVPLHDVDAALSVLPIGQSEVPESPARTSTLEAWGKGELHPAPLTREAVQRHRVSSRILVPAE